MIYKDFQGLQLSALGFGAMRLPVIDGDDNRVDAAATAEMVELAMSKGVNYYDTAWGYHGGHSETVLGEALRRYPRDTFYLADKFPGYDLGNMPKVREIFEAQLKKCGVEYFDFYLFHNVCELNIDAYLDPKYGIHDYLTEQKRSGRIRHLGFSCHGQLNVLRRFLEAYGRDMEFCQLQLNWLDWEFQDAKNKVELLGEYGIPVWVMEPLRGGALAHLTPERETALLALRPGWTKVYAESVSSRLIDSCVVCVMAPWDEPDVEYPTETVIYADVTIQGQPATQETLVAAFVGDELRAFGTFAYRRGTDETCMIFRIRHDPVEPGDPEPGKIELRYYDAPNYDLLRFMPDIAIDGESHGTPSNPVRIAF